MIKIFTQTDLIRYIYHETTEEETKEIKKALERDPELQNLFADLSSMQKQLDHATLEPSSKAILDIISYSRSTKPH